VFEARCRHGYYRVVDGRPLLSGCRQINSKV
jgi:hypothetical protein